MYTPWGQSQTEMHIAEGITEYTTASHGGIRLSDERQEIVKRMFPAFTTWVGGGWYEEDCDWAIVVLTFPQFFCEQRIYDAVRSVDWSAEATCKTSLKWVDAKAAIPQILRDRATRHAETIAELWEVGTMGSAGGGCVGVSLTRGDQRRAAQFADWPSKRYYTTAELDSLALAQRSI